MEIDLPEIADSVRDARRSQSIVRLVWRAMRLRCPACGQARIFRGWFAMHEICPACGRHHQRDAGFFLGSIYFNYGVTGLLVTSMYFAMFFSGLLTDRERLAVLAAFVFIFPAWFFRYARALWMAVDEWLDPWPNEEEARRIGGERRVASGEKDQLRA